MAMEYLLQSYCIYPIIFPFNPHAYAVFISHEKSCFWRVPMPNFFYGVGGRGFTEREWCQDISMENHQKSSNSRCGKWEIHVATSKTTSKPGNWVNLEGTNYYKLILVLIFCYQYLSESINGKLFKKTCFVSCRFLFLMQGIESKIQP